MSDLSKNLEKTWLKKAEAIGYTAVAATMSALYPIDFEAYMISFELCDSKGISLDFFTFPIMPTDLSVEEEIPVKIDNTFGGVNSISSNVYVPKSISLNGSFGRKFKTLIRNKVSIPFVQRTIQERDYGVKGIQKQELEVFNMLKTGFGCFKVLQSIVNRSVEVDIWGECNKLYMYNMAYGESYLVKPISFRGSQSTQNNGIWNYELNLKAVCPLHLDAHRQGGAIKAKVFAMAAGQSAVNSVVKGASDTVKSAI